MKLATPTLQLQKASVYIRQICTKAYEYDKGALGGASGKTYQDCIYKD